MFSPRALPTLCLILLLSCGKSEVTTQTISPESMGGSGSDALPMRWLIFPNNKLNLKIDDSFTDNAGPVLGERQQILEMRQRWNDAVNFEFFETTTELTTKALPDNLNSFNDGEIGIYRADQWYDDLNTMALAVTQYWGYVGAYDGRNWQIITHADIIMNHTYNFGLNEEALLYDFASVALHELGHLVGLLHNSSTTSVMYRSISPGVIKRDLASIDEDNINSNYSDITSFPVALEPDQPGLVVGAMREGTAHPDEGKPIRGIIYQMPDGTCQHYVNGELVETHRHR